MSLSETLASVPAEIVTDVEELLKMILSAPNSKTAVEAAKIAITDAADYATDEAVDAALKAGKP